LFYSG